MIQALFLMPESGKRVRTKIGIVINKARSKDYGRNKK